MFNLQSKWLNSNFGHFWQITKIVAYLLGKIGHFHHSLICNQNELIVKLVILDQNTKAIATKYQGYSLTSGRKFANFHDFSVGNQTASISMLDTVEEVSKATSVPFGQK